jgi:hypothetical protein
MGDSDDSRVLLTADYDGHQCGSPKGHPKIVFVFDGRRTESAMRRPTEEVSAFRQWGMPSGDCIV